MDKKDAIQKELFDDSSQIDFRRWASLVINYWYLYIFGLTGAILVAILISTLSEPVYEVKADLLVNENTDPLDKAAAFAPDLYFHQYQLENEKGILKSKGVTRRALDKLDFAVSYYSENRFRTVELYPSSPFNILIDSGYLQPVNLAFTLSFLNDTVFVIHSEGENVQLYDFTDRKFESVLAEFRYVDTLGFGELAGNQYCRFYVYPGSAYMKGDRTKYSFTFNDHHSLLKKYRGFRVENMRNSTILELTAKNRNPAKAADFLNAVSREYLHKGVERDNEIAKATIRFIDAQLVEIIDSLHFSGNELQNFKAKNKVLDISYQAEQEYTKLESYEQQKARLMMQKRYFSYLLNNLQSASEVSDLIAPSSLEINDPVMNSLIIELANFDSERAELSFNAIRDNPYQRSLELRINETRKKLTDAATNVLQTTEIALQEKEEQIRTAEARLENMPQSQQTLINIERKYRLNDELYNYLLTRRSEMQIFYASNLPANEVLEWAEASDAIRVSPNSRMILLSAILIGLALPSLLIYFREILNNKIRNKEDIQRLTDYPLLGHIVDHKTTQFPAVLKDPHSPLTESYRNLRTNLQFVIDEKASNVILVSSAVQGEGKSFTALNLASVYAFYGKRTILVDFDLRKSCLAKNIGIKSEKGLSNYLSRNATMKEIIIQSEQLNFDLICSGPFPPNPSELTDSEQTEVLFKTLKESYDIIIVDSPPIGIVSDAALLYSLIDITLLIVRYNYTRNEVFANVIESINHRGFEHVNIVLNDVVPKRDRYSYYYSYGNVKS